GLATNTVAWYENPGPSGLYREWTRRIVDDKLTYIRTVCVGDFNRDGRPDLLAAGVRDQIVWHENKGQGSDRTWVRRVIDATPRGAIHGHPVDFDADGDLDVVMAFGMQKNIPDEQHVVAWYENADHPDDPQSWTRHVVGKLPCAFEAIAVDIDGDKDL